MAFYGYKGDIEDYCWNSSYTYGVSSTSGHQLSAYDSSSSYYNEYESNYSSDPCTQHHEHVQYNSSDTDDYYYYYSLYNCNEPKLLQYEPPPPHYYHTQYFPSETKFTISYSKVEGDKDDYDFDEYDPTPYGGGYDIVSTYGKPLPLSDKTCYPRSTSKPEKPGNSVPPSPPRKPEEIPPEKILPSATKPPAEAKTDPQDSVGNAGVDVDEGSFDSETSEDEDGFENGMKGDYDYEIVERKVSDYVPYGSGLEAVDICESIFGHWPCLKNIERLEKERCRELGEMETKYDPFQLAADYLFGSSSSSYNDHHHHHHHHRSNYYQPQI